MEDNNSIPSRELPPFLPFPPCTRNTRTFVLGRTIPGTALYVHTVVRAHAGLTRIFGFAVSCEVMGIYLISKRINNNNNNSEKTTIGRTATGRGGVEKHIGN